MKLRSTALPLAFLVSTLVPCARAAPPAVAATSPATAAEAAPAVTSPAPAKKKAPPRKFVLAGEARVRWERLDGVDNKRYGTGRADGILLERTRLDLDWRFERSRHLFLELQDNRATSVALPPADRSGYWNPLDVHQFYVESTAAVGRPGYKLGRQTILYREGRVFGVGDWSNSGRNLFDAAKLTVRTPGVDVDLWQGQKVKVDMEALDHDHQPWDLYALYATTRKLPLKLDAFYTEKRDTGLERRSLGLYAEGGRKLLDWHGTLARQWGSEGGDDVSADAWNVGVGRTLKGRAKVRLGFDWTVASGDEDPGDATNNTFDGLFGSITRLYGRMSMFQWTNLDDRWFSVQGSPDQKTKVTLDVHDLKLDEPRDAWYWSSGKAAASDPTGAAGRDLGTEVDLIVEYTPRKDLAFSVGRSHFSPGDFVERTRSAASADWTYAQVTFKF